MAYGNTLLANMVNPEVLADMVEKKLVDKMVFAPLAVVDGTLSGRPGDTITLPNFTYIGDAVTLGEASTLSWSQLGTSTVSVQIHKAAVGIQISDEAILSGYGDPLGESAMQIQKSIASKVDNDMLSCLSGISGTMLFETTATTVNPAAADINSAIELFGEDIDDGEKVAIVSPAVYTELRSVTGWLPASDISADRLIRGSVGEAYGCQIIVSNKVNTSKDIYIVKPGALRLFMKRDTLVETAREIDDFTTKIAASKHYACYLYDASKAIRIAKKS